MGDSGIEEVSTGLAVLFRCVFLVCDEEEGRQVIAVKMWKHSLLGGCISMK
jgi:hypothetical protein